MASRSKKVRSEIRRKRRKLERVGGIRWKTIAYPDELQSFIKNILHIERRSWKEARGTSFTAVSGLGNFYAKLSQRCANRNWLRAFVLYMNDVPVAHMLGFVYRNEYYALKTSFDERYHSLSPGFVLATYALEHAFASGMRVFDFLGVPSRWKKELANDVSEHVNVCVFPPDRYRCLMCEFYHNRVKRFVKHHFPYIVWLQRRIAASKGERHKRRCQ